MSFDLMTIEGSLEKAKADVEFWESAKRVLSDPRISGMVNTDRQRTPASAFRPYGDVRRGVLAALPAFGDEPATSSSVIALMQIDDFVFAAKRPTVAVNDALIGLERAGVAVCVGRNGVAKLWTKAEVNGRSSETESGAD